MSVDCRMLRATVRVEKRWPTLLRGVCCFTSGLTVLLLEANKPLGLKWRTAVSSSLDGGQEKGALCDLLRGEAMG